MINNLSFPEIKKPDYQDMPEYYKYYVDVVQENNLKDALRNSLKFTTEVIEVANDEKANYQYAPEKWTIKKLLSHITDTERIFAYRALRLSRLDATLLSGFDENFYAQNSNCSQRNITQLLAEYESVRTSTQALFEYMTDEMLDFKGTANTVSVTARGIGFMIAGHNIHHLNILKERYL